MESDLAEASLSSGLQVREVGITKLKGIADVLGSGLVGQEHLIRSMLVCLLCEGHILVEGMPGLAKTMSARMLARSMEGSFSRIQFTPDLLPSDVTGSEIYNHDSGQFSFKRGPIFENFILADEINRAPAKVQSALLEAMAERQVTVGNNSYKLPNIFMVLATQNPIEQAGTYTLPEAQLDRFFMHVMVDYPNHDEELAIMDLNLTNHSDVKITTLEEVAVARKQANSIYIDNKLKHYIVSLVRATRNAMHYEAKLAEYIKYGASPRATIALARAARALAWLEGQDCVLPAHIQQVAPDILRHRLILSFEAQAEEVTSQDIINKLINLVAVP